MSLSDSLDERPVLAGPPPQEEFSLMLNDSPMPSTNDAGRRDDKAAPGLAIALPTLPAQSSQLAIPTEDSLPPSPQERSAEGSTSGIHGSPFEVEGEKPRESIEVSSPRDTGAAPDPQRPPPLTSQLAPLMPQMGKSVDSPTMSNLTFAPGTEEAIAAARAALEGRTEDNRADFACKATPVDQAPITSLFDGQFGVSPDPAMNDAIPAAMLDDKEDKGASSQAAMFQTQPSRSSLVSGSIFGTDKHIPLTEPIANVPPPRTDPIRGDPMTTITRDQGNGLRYRGGPSEPSSRANDSISTMAYANSVILPKDFNRSNIFNNSMSNYNDFGNGNTIYRGVSPPVSGRATPRSFDVSARARSFSITNNNATLANLGSGGRLSPKAYWDGDSYSGGVSSSGQRRRIIYAAVSPTSGHQKAYPSPNNKETESMNASVSFNNSQVRRGDTTPNGASRQDSRDKLSPRHEGFTGGDSESNKSKQSRTRILASTHGNSDHGQVQAGVGSDAGSGGRKSAGSKQQMIMSAVEQEENENVEAPKESRAKRLIGNIFSAEEDQEDVIEGGGVSGNHQFSDCYYRIPWDQRSTMPAMPSDSMNLCQCFVAPRFWERIDWTIRTTLCVVPTAIIALHPSTTHHFPLPGVAIVMALWVSAPTFGESLREFLTMIKSCMITMFFMVIMVALNLNEKWEFLLWYFSTILIVGILAEETKKTVCFLLSVMYTYYFNEKNVHGYEAMLSFYKHLTFGLAIGCASFFLPRINWSLELAKNYCSILASTSSVSILGLCNSFYVRDLDRELNLVRIRQLKYTSSKAIPMIDKMLHECVYEPHSQMSIERIKRRRDLLETIMNIVNSTSQIIEIISYNPSIMYEMTTSGRFARNIQSGLLNFASVMDTLLLKICDFKNNVTSADIEDFRTQHEEFERIVDQARESVMYNDRDFSPDSTDIVLGAFLFSVTEIADTLASFREPDEVEIGSHCSSLLKNLWEGVRGTANNILMTVKSTARGHITRRFKEAIKLSMAMTLSAIVEFAMESSDPLSGSCLIAWVTDNVGVGTFNLMIMRVLGTVFGSILAFMAAELVNGSLMWILITIAFLTFCGAYVQSSASYRYAGNAFIWGVVSIASKFDLREVAIVRFTANVVAVLIYFVISFVVWPIRTNTRIKLNLDESLRGFREATLILLQNLDDPEIDIKASTEPEITVLTHSIIKEESLLPAAVREPTMIGAAFAEEQWLKIIRSQKSLVHILYMLQFSLKVIFHSHSSSDVREMLHWDLIAAIKEPAWQIADMIFESVSFYLLMISKLSTVPTRNLVNLRIQLTTKQAELEIAFVQALTRMIRGEGMTEEETTDQNCEEWAYVKPQLADSTSPDAERRINPIPPTEALPGSRRASYGPNEDGVFTLEAKNVLPAAEKSTDDAKAKRSSSELSGFVASPPMPAKSSVANESFSRPLVSLLPNVTVTQEGNAPKNPTEDARMGSDPLANTVRPMRIVQRRRRFDERRWAAERIIGGVAGGDSDDDARNNEELERQREERKKAKLARRQESFDDDTSQGAPDTQDEEMAVENASTTVNERDKSIMKSILDTIVARRRARLEKTEVKIDNVNVNATSTKVYRMLCSALNKARERAGNSEAEALKDGATAGGVKDEATRPPYNPDAPPPETRALAVAAEEPTLSYQDENQIEDFLRKVVLKDLDSLQAYVFGMRALITELGRFEKALLEMLHVEEINEII